MHVADPLPRLASGVVLRRLVPSDLAAFQAYRLDPETGRYQGWSATSDAEAMEFLQEMSVASFLEPGLWFQVGIADPEGSQLLGDLGLRLSEDCTKVDLGFTLAPTAQSRGLGTVAVREAIDLVFEFTAARRIVAVTDARNLPAIRLLERVGMQQAGSQCSTFRGESCVEHTYILARHNAG